MVKENWILPGKYCSLFSFIYGIEWQHQRLFKAANGGGLVANEHLKLD